MSQEAIIKLWEGVGRKLKPASPTPKRRQFSICCPDCGAIAPRRCAVRVILDEAVAIWICRGCADAYGVEDGGSL